MLLSPFFLLFLFWIVNGSPDKQSIFDVPPEGNDYENLNEAAPYSFIYTFRPIADGLTYGFSVLTNSATNKQKCRQSSISVMNTGNRWNEGKFEVFSETFSNLLRITSPMDVFGMWSELKVTVTEPSCFLLKFHPIAIIYDGSSEVEGNADYHHFLFMENTHATVLPLNGSSCNEGTILTIGKRSLLYSHLSRKSDQLSVNDVTLSEPTNTECFQLNPIKTIRNNRKVSQQKKGTTPTKESTVKSQRKSISNKKGILFTKKETIEKGQGNRKPLNTGVFGRTNQGKKENVERETIREQQRTTKRQWNKKWLKEDSDPSTSVPPLGEVHNPIQSVEDKYFDPHTIYPQIPQQLEDTTEKTTVGQLSIEHESQESENTEKDSESQPLQLRKTTKTAKAVENNQSGEDSSLSSNIHSSDLNTFGGDLSGDQPLPIFRKPKRTEQKSGMKKKVVAKQPVTPKSLSRDAIRDKPSSEKENGSLKSSLPKKKQKKDKENKEASKPLITSTSLPQWPKGTPDVHLHCEVIPKTSEEEGEEESSEPLTSQEEYIDSEELNDEDDSVEEVFEEIIHPTKPLPEIVEEIDATTKTVKTSTKIGKMKTPKKFNKPTKKGVVLAVKDSSENSEKDLVEITVRLGGATGFLNRRNEKLVSFNSKREDEDVGGVTSTETPDIVLDELFNELLKKKKEEYLEKRTFTKKNESTSEKVLSSNETSVVDNGKNATEAMDTTNTTEDSGIEKEEEEQTTKKMTTTTQILLERKVERMKSNLPSNKMTKSRETTDEVNRANKSLKRPSHRQFNGGYPTPAWKTRKVEEDNYLMRNSQPKRQLSLQERLRLLMEEGEETRSKQEDDDSYFYSKHGTDVVELLTNSDSVNYNEVSDDDRKVESLIKEHKNLMFQAERISKNLQEHSREAKRLMSRVGKGERNSEIFKRSIERIEEQIPIIGQSINGENMSEATSEFTTQTTTESSTSSTTQNTPSTIAIEVRQQILRDRMRLLHLISPISTSTVKEISMKDSTTPSTSPSISPSTSSSTSPSTSPSTSLSTSPSTSPSTSLSTSPSTSPTPSTSPIIPLVNLPSLIVDIPTVVGSVPDSAKFLWETTDNYESTRLPIDYDHEADLSFSSFVEPEKAPEIANGVVNRTLQRLLEDGESVTTNEVGEEETTMENTNNQRIEDIAFQLELAELRKEIEGIRWATSTPSPSPPSPSTSSLSTSTSTSASSVPSTTTSPSPAPSPSPIPSIIHNTNYIFQPLANALINQLHLRELANHLENGMDQLGAIQEQPILHSEELLNRLTQGIKSNTEGNMKNKEEERNGNTEEMEAANNQLGINVTTEKRNKDEKKEKEIIVESTTTEEIEEKSTTEEIREGNTTKEVTEKSTTEEERETTTKEIVKKEEEMNVTQYTESITISFASTEGNSIAEEKVKNNNYEISHQLDESPEDINHMEEIQKTSNYSELVFMEDFVFFPETTTAEEESENNGDGDRQGERIRDYNTVQYKLKEKQHQQLQSKLNEAPHSTPETHPIDNSTQQLYMQNGSEWIARISNGNRNDCNDSSIEYRKGLDEWNNLFESSRPTETIYATFIPKNVLLKIYKTMCFQFYPFKGPDNEKVVDILIPPSFDNFHDNRKIVPGPIKITNKGNKAYTVRLSEFATNYRSRVKKRSTKSIGNCFKAGLYRERGMSVVSLDFSQNDIVTFDIPQESYAVIMTMDTQCFRYISVDLNENPDLTKETKKVHNTEKNSENSDKSEHLEDPIPSVKTSKEQTRKKSPPNEFRH